AEAGHLVAGPGHTSVDQVEETGAYDDQSGVTEHPRLVVAIGIAEQECRDGIDHQAQEGKHVGIDLRQGKPADDGVEQHAASPAKGASPGHAHRTLVTASSSLGLVTWLPSGRGWWSGSESPSRGCRWV